MSAAGEPRGEGGDGDRVEFLYAGQAASEIPRDVTHVRVDPSVKKIPGLAFLLRERLEEVDLHGGLEEIGEYAFGGCTSLKRARIPAAVKRICRGAFKGCEQLNELDLCEGLGEVGECAFSRCKRLKRVRFPPTVKNIGEGAFSHCGQLRKLDLCEGLGEIAGSAFSGCKCLKHVRIPSTVKKIGKRAFGDCIWLEEVELCDGFGEIDEYAFYRCISLKRVRIPPTLRKIGKRAFEGCKHLEEVEFCEGVGEIDEYAFCRCISLKRARMPPTVKKIGKRAFEDCERLRELELCEGVGEIDKYAFYRCKSLRRVRIPPTVKKIGGGAFGGCEKLKELNLCEGVEEIGGSAFCGCKSLKCAGISSTVKNIGRWAFEDCEQLEEVNLCEGLKNIGTRAFARCKSLRHIAFPLVEQIGESAFDNCKSLHRIRIPSTVKMIAKGVFSGCIRLLSVELNDGLEEIGELAFENCFSLRNISVPSTVKKMEGDALRGCYDLQRLLGTQNESANALKCRLGWLPMHQLCYGQSHCPSQEVVGELQNVFGITSDQGGTSILTESSPDQKKRDENMAATWSESGPNNQERCHRATNSDSAVGSAMASGASYSLSKTYTMIDPSQDCLGMTPLHILAFSTKQNFNLYQFIIALQPKCLITKDKWDCPPIIYTIWGSCSPEIVQFLIDSQQSAFPDIDLNWDMMVSSLCRAAAPMNVIQRVLEIKQTSFIEHNINWQTAAQELLIQCFVGCDASDNYLSLRLKYTRQAFIDSEAHQDLVRCLAKIYFSACCNEGAQCWNFAKLLKGWWQPQSIDFSLVMTKFLARCNIPERLCAIGVRKWQKHIKYLVEKGSSVVHSDLSPHLDTLHSKLVFYEREYSQLKEKTSLIELVLWKFKIGESIVIQHDDVGPSNGPDEPTAGMKTRCRINCGAGIIIPNVLPYLITDPDKDTVGGGTAS